MPAGSTPYPRQQFPPGYYISSAEDMAHALFAFLNAGIYQGQSVLSAAGIKELHHPVLTNYAMGWASSNGVLAHNGAVPDYGSQILIDPRHQIGIVVLFNINNAIGTDHLYILGPNMLNLLTDSALAPTPSRSAYRTYLVIIPALLAAEIAWLVLSLARLKRWQKGPEIRPHGIRAAFVLDLPVTIEFLLAAYFMQQMTEGIPNALLHQPDLTILILILFGLLILWGSIRSIIGTRSVLLEKVATA